MEDGVPRGGKAARGGAVRRARGGPSRRRPSTKLRTAPQDERGKGEEAKGKSRRAPPPRSTRSPSPATAGEDVIKVRPSKHRIIQVARAGRRKLFDEGRRELFLEWFAATCNVCLSAEKAGISYKTVFKHRMKDEGFAVAWDRALAQGYAYLEARSLQEGLPALPLHEIEEALDAAPHPPTASRRVPPSPTRGEGLKGPTEAEVEKHFDVELALRLLREHARRLPTSPDKRKHFRTTARVASNAEVRAALVKRLAAFGRRMGKGRQCPDVEPSPEDS